MYLRGLIQSADLDESPPDSGNIEMVVRVQGVGPSQPRRLVVPHALLLRDETLDPESVVGRAFDAEVEQDDQGRWIVHTIALASRVLRRPD